MSRMDGGSTWSGIQPQPIDTLNQNGNNDLDLVLDGEPNSSASTGAESPVTVSPSGKALSHLPTLSATQEAVVKKWRGAVQNVLAKFSAETSIRDAQLFDPITSHWYAALEACFVPFTTYQGTFSHEYSQTYYEQDEIKIMEVIESDFFKVVIPAMVKASMSCHLKMDTDEIRLLEELNPELSGTLEQDHVRSFRELLQSAETLVSGQSQVWRKSLTTARYRSSWAVPYRFLDDLLKAHVAGWFLSFFAPLNFSLKGQANSSDAAVRKEFEQLGKPVRLADVDVMQRIYQEEWKKSKTGDLWCGIPRVWWEGFSRVIELDHEGKKGSSIKQAEPETETQFVLVSDNGEGSASAAGGATAPSQQSLTAVDDPNQATPHAASLPDGPEAATAAAAEEEAAFLLKVKGIGPITGWEIYRDCADGQWEFSGYDRAIVFIPERLFDYFWLRFGGGPKVMHMMSRNEDGIIGHSKKLAVKLRFKIPEITRSPPHSVELKTWPNILTARSAIEYAATHLVYADEQKALLDALSSDPPRVALQSESDEDIPIHLDLKLKLSEYNSYTIVRALLPGESRYPRGHCGLTNLGNTCFMNAALQCCMNVASLRNQLKLALPTLTDETPITLAFANLIERVWSGSSKSVNPRSFREAFIRKKRAFDNFEQHDSIEFADALLDCIHEELNLVKKKKYRERQDSDVNVPPAELQRLFWEDYLANNQSFMPSIFHGHMKSQIQCVNCEKIRTVFDAFTSFPLTVEKLEKTTYTLEVVDAEMGHSHTCRIRVPCDSPLSVIRAEVLKLQCVAEKGLKAEDLDVVRLSYSSTYVTVLTSKLEIGAKEELKVFITRGRRQYTVPVLPARPPTPPPVPVVTVPPQHTEGAPIQDSDPSQTLTRNNVDGVSTEGAAAEAVAEAGAGAGAAAGASEQPSQAESTNATTTTPAVAGPEPAPQLPALTRILFSLSLETSSSFGYYNHNQPPPVFQCMLYLPANAKVKDFAAAIAGVLRDRLEPAVPGGGRSTTPLPTTDSGEGNRPVATKVLLDDGELADREGAGSIASEQPASSPSPTSTSENETPAAAAAAELEVDNAFLRKALVFERPDRYSSKKIFHPFPSPSAEADPMNYEASETEELMHVPYSDYYAHKIDGSEYINVGAFYKDKLVHFKPLSRLDDPSLTKVPENHEVPTEATLQKCFERASNPHKVDDQVYCPHCKSHQDAISEARIWVPPEVLIIQFKRFHFSPVTFAMKKVATKVEFPLHLDIAPYVTAECAAHGDAETKYHLLGVIHHSGSVSFGHYTATCWNPTTQQWIDLDDSYASERNEPPSPHLAYILFYQKCSTSTAVPPAAPAPAAVAVSDTNDGEATATIPADYHQL